ncbi:hypothetical protein GWI33_002135 [Rhynchophorus ferrugineus]|uniref:Uncharacterized protein n=1 Tax=Rhynchophorus ferrugineus TaxID=354439 RepID=A0A834M393_RHYFE|nr:hypothetical protein GWI33_002135 [Rhynchophorus ferrugineus]
MTAPGVEGTGGDDEREKKIENLPPTATFSIKVEMARPVPPLIRCALAVNLIQFRPCAPHTKSVKDICLKDVGMLRSLTNFIREATDAMLSSDVN